MDKKTIARFWSKVERGEVNECWPWIGYIDRLGYGRWVATPARPRKRYSSHRLAFALACGPIPDGLCVCHKCDNPPCCNPDHLFLGTRRDNALDMIHKGRMYTGPEDIRVAALPRGAAQWHARLTEADVLRIRALVAGGARLREVGARYGLRAASVGAIAIGRSWKHVGGPLSSRRNDGGTGSRHHNAKLTEADVLRIRKLAADGSLFVHLAAQFGVGRTAVGQIVNRRTWRHI